MTSAAASARLDAKLHDAVALHRAGRLIDAQRLYGEILEAQPRHFDALHLLGVIAAVTGNPRAAVEYIANALAIDPHSAIAHYNHGASLHECGRLAAALASFDRAIELQDRYVDAYNNRGNVLKDLGRWRDALDSYDRALALNADHVRAHVNRGAVLTSLGAWDDATRSYDRALSLDPGFVDAHVGLGNLLCKVGRWKEALGCCDRALAQTGDHSKACVIRGFALYELSRWDDALASLDRAVALDAKDAEAHDNRATVLVSLRRLDEALQSYGRAIEVEPGRVSAYVNRALARLLVGDYERGWEDYEWRRRQRGFGDSVSGGGRGSPEGGDGDAPLWLGEFSLTGKTILVRSEQGYGDVLQFCRYIPLVAERGERVVVEVPGMLVALLRESLSMAQVTVIAQGDPVPAFDCHCSLLSLPRALGTTVATIPARVPYLAPPAQRVRRWRDWVAERVADGRPDRARVGLVWASGALLRPDLQSTNARRDIPYAKLARLAHPGIQFISLQKGLGQHDAAHLDTACLDAAQFDAARRHPGGVDNMLDAGRDIEDFADTAALIAHLDLVISVDTSTAHLAGAMGVPLWVLLRFDACWRWFLEGEDSAWYPTARLYRQQQAGDWDPVVNRVREDLSRWLDARERI